jgi:hypothetical protein
MLETCLDDDAVLEAPSNLARGDCGNRANESDSSILEVQHMGTDRQATEGNLVDTALLEVQLNFVIEGSDNLANDRDQSILSLLLTFYRECNTHLI